MLFKKYQEVITLHAMNLHLAKCVSLQEAQLKETATMKDMNSACFEKCYGVFSDSGANMLGGAVYFFIHMNEYGTACAVTMMFNRCML